MRHQHTRPRAARPAAGHPAAGHPSGGERAQGSKQRLVGLGLIDHVAAYHPLPTARPGGTLGGSTPRRRRAVGWFREGEGGQCAGKALGTAAPLERRHGWWSGAVRRDEGGVEAEEGDGLGQVRHKHACPQGGSAWQGVCRMCVGCVQDVCRVCAGCVQGTLVGVQEGGEIGGAGGVACAAVPCAFHAMHYARTQPADAAAATQLDDARAAEIAPG